MDREWIITAGEHVVNIPADSFGAHEAVKICKQVLQHEWKEGGTPPKFIIARCDEHKYVFNVSWKWDRIIWSMSHEEYLRVFTLDQVDNGLGLKFIRRQ